MLYATVAVLEVVAVWVAAYCLYDTVAVVEVVKLWVAAYRAVWHCCGTGGGKGVGSSLLSV